MFHSSLLISALMLLAFTPTSCTQQEDGPEPGSHKFILEGSEQEQNSKNMNLIAEKLRQRNIDLSGLSPVDIEMLLASLGNTELPAIQFDPNALRVMSMEYTTGKSLIPRSAESASQDYALIATFFSFIVGGGVYAYTQAHNEKKTESVTGLGPKVSLSLGVTVGTFIVVYLFSYLMDATVISPARFKKFFTEEWPRLREVEYLFGPSSIALGDEIKKLVDQGRWGDVFSAVSSLKK